jgi:cytoskeletal protein CcmA (bactofilin family)
MFKKKQGAVSPASIDSLIGVGTRIEGQIHFTGGLRIDGEVVGSVLSDPAGTSTLVVSDQACIEGAVSVSHMIINGTVKGPVKVGASIEMHSKARIEGDLEYCLIEMHPGAVVEGRLLHRQGAVELPPPAED